jgi:uncharacterized protein (DUF1697 family)
MARLVVLLRGINIGSRNRISMPELRKALEDGGYDDIRTYLQSGNVVLTSTASAKKVARECERLIADRRNNRYRKLVTDPETGEVVRDVDKPLTEHAGHGDARRKP